MVRLSTFALPETDKVIVYVLESVTAIEALVISLPAVKEMPGVTVVLNSNPAGAFKTSVPPPMSPLFPLASVRTMAVSDVNDGVGAFAAVSAERPVPPVAAVIAPNARAANMELNKNPARNFGVLALAQRGRVFAA
jgi:hypothetical protein